jgi:hypothetical protein
MSGCPFFSKNGHPFKIFLGCLSRQWSFETACFPGSQRHLQGVLNRCFLKRWQEKDVMPWRDRAASIAGIHWFFIDFSNKTRAT